MFVTPEDPVISELALTLTSIEAAYNIANEWIYVPELVLNGITDRWLTPTEFITETPWYANNPMPGHIAGDCEEQANTLASILRAQGIAEECVRVALGKVAVSEDQIQGHVWVEVYMDGKWLALDPSQGPKWDASLNKLIIREGLNFNYYMDHPYPVPGVSAYYNDMYYWDTQNHSGNAPNSWK